MKRYYFFLLLAAGVLVPAGLWAQVYDLSRSSQPVEISGAPVQNKKGPSFDCKRAATPSEKLICLDSTLSEADGKMATLYKSLLSKSSPNEITDIKSSQRQWLQRRETACENASLCYQYYMTRMTLLQVMLDQPSQAPLLSEFERSLCGTGCSVALPSLIGNDHKGNSMYFVNTDLPDGTWLVLVRGNRVLTKQFIGKVSFADSSGDDLEDRIKDGVVTLPTDCAPMAWMGCNYISFQLDPFKPISVGFGNVEKRSVWNWGTFSGNGSSRSEDDNGQEMRIKYSVIPDIDNVDPFADNIPLGNCALTLNKESGFLLTGHLPPNEEPILKALLVKGSYLIVDVPGESWTHGAPNWLNDDHLEIWGVESEYASNGPHVYQWGIRLSDGEVFPAYGHPKQLSVRMKDLQSDKGQKVRVFQIGFPHDVQHEISLSYSAGDGRDKVKWLLSTSQLKYGNSRSIGVTYKIDPNVATCAVSNGTLNVKYTTEFNPEEPLFK